jgi:asparagine synthase (glutamine-hydrolysing)
LIWGVAMSIIFGIRKPEGDSVQEEYLARLAHTTERYAPDGTFVRAAGRIGMGFQPYHTHQRAKLEVQPAVDARCNMLTFDGRLDNQAELAKQLNIDDHDTPDSLIVLAAFERWGEMCFSKLIGDWALAIWSELDDSLYLARDHAGTRTLFVEIAGDTVLWATYLETFFAVDPTRDLDEVYAACYLAAQPTRELTPYKGIRAVAPAHYLKFKGLNHYQNPHWTSRMGDQIHYRSDVEYEENFLSLFQQSVDRRSGSGAPTLAELSGGMDSTSIVCISDHARKQQGGLPANLLDTISFYDDNEPHWNERPFFTVVERTRDKQGIHINTSREETSYEPPDAAYLWPGPDALSLRRELAFEDQISQRDYRIILSGFGGDELLGGPPNPSPELADYAFKGCFSMLLRQAFSWSLQSREPLIQTLSRTTQFVRHLYPTLSPKPRKLPPWVLRRHRKRYADPNPSEFRQITIGLLPSVVDNSLTWWNMLETLPHRYPRALRRREYRYPYLDRDLVDFLFRVPPSKILKPGRRRYLMRNAMRGIVPTEILERRRKAFVSRGPMVLFSRDRERITELFSHSALGDAGLLDTGKLQEALRESNSALITTWLAPLRRVVQFELWLKANGFSRTFSKGYAVS